MFELARSAKHAVSLAGALRSWFPFSPADPKLPPPDPDPKDPYPYPEVDPDPDPGPDTIDPRGEPLPA